MQAPANLVKDRALQLYGIGLCFSEFITGFYFWEKGFIKEWAYEKPPICWPCWQNCAYYRSEDWPLEYYQAWVAAIMSFAVLASLLYLFRQVQWAYRCHVLSFALKMSFVALDFRMRHNGHIMVFWSTMTFLISADRDSARVLLATYYFWAGTLKPNQEWMSGAGIKPFHLFPRWAFPDWIVPHVCAYAIVLELVWSWGLLANSNIWLAMAFVQFLMFHISSFTVVGYFYPLLMFGLLLCVPLFAWDERHYQGPSLLKRFFTGQASMVCYTVFVLFCYVQIVPLSYKGDLALSGEGRILRLHMIDSFPVCQRSTSLRTIQTGETTQLPFLKGRIIPRRVKCDPWVIMFNAHNQCQDLKRSRQLGKKTIDVKLLSRRLTDTDYKVVVDEKDVCRRFFLRGEKIPETTIDAFRYAWWGHNDWIFPELTSHSVDDSEAKTDAREL